MKLINETSILTTLTQHLSQEYENAPYTSKTIHSIKEKIEKRLVDEISETDRLQFEVEVPQPLSYSHQTEQTFYLKENGERRIAVMYRFNKNFGMNFLTLKKLTGIQVL